MAFIAWYMRGTTYEWAARKHEYGELSHLEITKALEELVERRVEIWKKEILEIHEALELLKSPVTPPETKCDELVTELHAHIQKLGSYCDLMSADEYLRKYKALIIGAIIAALLHDDDSFLDHIFGAEEVWDAVTIRDYTVPLFSRASRVPEVV